jgi:import inner membrane translocase subunit TIM23
MHVEDKYTLKPKKSKDDMYLEGYGKHWGEKLTFTIGVSYTLAGIVGLFVGYRRFRPSVMYSSLESSKQRLGTCMKTAGEFGNSGAAASLLYCLVSKTIDLLFEEEINEYGYSARNVVSGGVTGILYKSTLGYRPMIFGGILGALLISGVTHGANYLNEKGLIRFRIEV